MANAKRWNIVAATLVVVTLAGATTAAAEESAKTEKSTVKVSYEDLNIHSKAGARVPYARLKNASEKVCNVRPPRELGNLPHNNKFVECYEEALSDAVEQIDSDELHSIHAS